MTSYLPYEFRVLRHVERIYARDLPVTLCFTCDAPPSDTPDAENDAATRATASSSAPPAAVHTASDPPSVSSSPSASTSSSSSSPSSVSVIASAPHVLADAPGGAQRGGASRASVTCRLTCAPSAFFVLRYTASASWCEPGPIAYVSEVYTESRQPTWRRIPAHVATTANGGSPSLVWWELYYTPSCLLVEGDSRLRALVEARVKVIAPPAAPDAVASTDARRSRSGVLVQRVCVPLSSLLYLGTDVSAVDARLRTAPLDTLMVPSTTTFLPTSEHRSSAVGMPLAYHLLMQCVDGIFEYSSAAAQSAVANLMSPRACGADQPQSTTAARTPSLPLSKYAEGYAADSPSSSTVPWLRSPAGESLYRLRTAARSPATDPSALTAGDLKLLTTASAAWQNLLHIAQARRQASLDALDAVAEASKAERRAAADVAQRQQAVSDAQEAVTLQALRVERLRQQVTERESHAAHLRAQLAQSEALTTDPHRPGGSMGATRVDGLSLVAQQELHYAKVRASLGAAQRVHVSALRHVFPLELTGDREYASPAYRSTRRAKDEIGGCVLPVVICDGARRSHGHDGDDDDIVFEEDTAAPVDHGGSTADQAPGPRPALKLRTGARLVLPAQSDAEAHEEALALAHVAHVLSTLAILYGCSLPHPVLLAGARSRILVRADARGVDVAPPVTSTGAMMLSAGAAVLMPSPSLFTWPTTEAVAIPQHSLPFLVTRASEHPLVVGAVQLLRRDALAVAECMGLTSSVASCGLRLGAVVQVLLSE